MIRQMSKEMRLSLKNFWGKRSGKDMCSEKRGTELVLRWMP